MRNRWFLAVVFFLLAANAQADPLQVGMTASDWSFKDADGKDYTMETWAGKVLVVNYVDPDEADLNEHFTDAMKKAKDDGRLKYGDIEVLCGPQQLLCFAFGLEIMALATTCIKGADMQQAGHPGYPARLDDAFKQFDMHPAKTLTAKAFFIEYPCHGNHGSGAFKSLGQLFL